MKIKNGALTKSRLGLQVKLREADESTFFKNLLTCYSHHSAVPRIKKAIASKGLWESSDEWRIFTTTEKKIEKITEDNKVWYRVTVKCDSEHICHCQTIERAVDFVAIFDGFIQQEFWAFGWPSQRIIKKGRKAIP